MARRIRDFDWTAHPFGPPEHWPQSLRSALSICLHSAFPTAIYWGSELRLLYNDAWAPIPGPRHPAALGAPAREVWSDIWHVIEPQFSRLIATGEGVFVEDQLLPMRRFGAVEETYWSYSFTAIRGEDGKIAGVFNSGSETTRHVISRRQMTFLLDLSEAFRTARDSDTARGNAIRMLGEHLGADRVGFREAAPRGEGLAIVDEWTAPGVMPVGSGVSVKELGDWVAAQLDAGHALRIDDVAGDPRLGGARDAFVKLGVGAALAVPWMNHDRAEAIIFAHSRAPRAWTDYDVSTAEEVLERTLGWLERERATEREWIMMREIDHRARNALGVVHSVAKLTRAPDVEAFREKIADRIAALARTHDLLSAERWRAVELKDLIASELAPHADAATNSVTLLGPEIRLQPEHAQTIALLLHELTTNAAKYGALSQPGGSLDVRWDVNKDGAIRFDWIERLAAPKSASGEPERKGFGTTLLKQVVEAQLGGSISRTFEEGGMTCRIEVPLGNTGPRKGPAAASAAPGAAARKRVLIVEDEALLALDLEVMIQDMGLAVFATAASVQDALSCLKGGAPDLAVLDANLAGESSQPVAEALLALGVPIIFATGYARLTGMPEAMTRFPHLAKPITAAQLAEAVAGLGVPVDSPG